jgi:hypothetical protein
VSSGGEHSSSYVCSFYFSLFPPRWALLAQLCVFKWSLNGGGWISMCSIVTMLMSNRQSIDHISC